MAPTAAMVGAPPPTAGSLQVGPPKTEWQKHGECRRQRFPREWQYQWLLLVAAAETGCFEEGPPRGRPFWDGLVFRESGNLL